jgi:hypothetical protein
MPTNYYIAYNGYGYFEDGSSPELSRHALITSDYVYVPNGTSIEIPFYTEDDIEVVYTRDGSQTTVDTASDYDETAASSVKYITFSPNTNNTPYDIQVYNDGQTSLLKTIKLIPICEPKYTPIQCYFMNKYGVIQQTYFFKRSDENMSVTDDIFKRNTITSSATYATDKHQNKRFNINAQTSLRLNTGFVDENFNSTIKELFLSEYVWLVYDGNKLPSVPKSKQLRYKVNINDKLVDYTVDFDFAFDTINSVR